MQTLNMIPRCKNSQWYIAMVLLLASFSMNLLHAATVVYQVNCGGDAVGSFSADNYFSGGQAYTTAATVDTSAVTNPPPVEVYNSVRALYQGNFSYTFPGLNAGSPYVVRLHFADVFSTEAGQRIFNVAINGAAALTDFDVIGIAGGPSIAISPEFATSANAAGEIVIQFSYVIDSALPAAIEILTSDSTAPSVLLTSPADNTTLNEPATINLLATASANSGTIAKVDFYQGASLLSSDSTTPFAFEWNNVSAGNYTLTAVATDNHGLNNTSPPVRVKVIGAGFPVHQINCGGPAVGAYASDNFFVGGTAYTKDVVVDTSNVQNPPPPAVYTTVRATGASSFGYLLPGLVAGANYTVRIHFADVFSANPGERMFNIDINRARVLSDFDIIAAVGGPNIALVKEFPASADAGGNILISFGNVVDSALPAAIEVLGGTVGLPSALISKPGNGAVFQGGSAVPIEVSTSDNGTITKVEFFNGTEKLGESSTAPYTLTWATAAPGTYVLLAKVTDNAGNSSVAAGVAVTVHQSGHAYQINCGGEAVGPFAADAHFAGGVSYVKSATVDASAVPNPPPLGVYDSVRAIYQGSFRYLFPNLVPAGPYTVRLHFADTYSASAGDRVFNVRINDQAVLTDFDVITEAGAPSVAIVRDFSATADDAGQITIDFSYIVDSAIPAAIDILGELSVSAPILTILHSGGQLMISWEGTGFSLQEVTNLGDAWTTLPAASSPYTPQTTSARRFYRLIK